MKMFFALALIFASAFSSAKMTLTQREPPPRWNECQNCHRQKSYNYVPKSKKANSEHKYVQLKHGRKDMSCNFCHNKNNHNFLFSAQSSNDFSNSSLTCQTCHSDVYRKWSAGTHGKRSGGWGELLTMRVQYQCIDCHNPHSVSFPLMRALAPPYRPRFSIPKEEHD